MGKPIHSKTAEFYGKTDISAGYCLQVCMDFSHYKASKLIDE
jgi:hypothetical protein